MPENIYYEGLPYASGRSIPPLTDASLVHPMHVGGWDESGFMPLYDVPPAAMDHWGPQDLGPDHETLYQHDYETLIPIQGSRRSPGGSLYLGGPGGPPGYPAPRPDSAYPGGGYPGGGYPGGYPGMDMAPPPQHPDMPPGGYHGPNPAAPQFEC
eukprot:2849668-Rhodomonas_salina.1